MVGWCWRGRCPHPPRSRLWRVARLASPKSSLRSDGGGTAEVTRRERPLVRHATGAWFRLRSPTGVELTGKQVGGARAPERGAPPNRSGTIATRELRAAHLTREPWPQTYKDGLLASSTQLRARHPVSVDQPTQAPAECEFLPARLSYQIPLHGAGDDVRRSQHLLNFCPLPHGHGSLRPIFGASGLG